MAQRWSRLLVLARDSAEPLNLNRARTLWANPELRQDFTALNLARPESWPAHFRLGNQDLMRWSSRSRINSDDRTLLEYTAPRHLVRPEFTAELEGRVRSAEQQPFSASFPTEEVSRLAIASAATAFEGNSDQAGRFLQAVPSGNTTPEAAVLRARSNLKAGDAAGAAQDLASIARTSNQSGAKYWLAIAQRAQGLPSVADATLREFLRENPDSERGLRAKADIASA